MGRSISEIVSMIGGSSAGSASLPLKRSLVRLSIFMVIVSDEITQDDWAKFSRGSQVQRDSFVVGSAGDIRPSPTYSISCQRNSSKQL